MRITEIRQQKPFTSVNNLETQIPFFCSLKCFSSFLIFSLKKDTVLFPEQLLAVRPFVFKASQSMVGLGWVCAQLGA